MKEGVKGHDGQEKELLGLLPLLRREDLSAGRRRELVERMGQDPQRKATLERWQRRWDDLELPPPGAAPLGFASRLAAQVRGRVEGELRWSFAPRWARLAAAAALLVGTAGGVSLGLWQAGSGQSGLGSSGLEQLAEWADQGSLAGSLADDYWLLLDQEATNSGEVSR